MLKYLVASFLLTVVSGDVSSQTDKIMSNILKDYKTTVRPADDKNATGVTLYLDVIPLHIHVDPETSTLLSHVWFVMKWKDERLKWNAIDYENVSMVHLGPDSIWTPDMMVWNSVQHFNYDVVDIMVRNTGQVFWVPPVNLHTSCEMDWTYWPWDIQQCHLVVGSWTKTGGEINLRNGNNKNLRSLDRGNYKAGAYALTGGLMKRQTYNYTTDVFYVSINVRMDLARRSNLDKQVAVMPLLAAASLLLATFWTHPAAPSRLRLNSFVCVILIMTLLGLRLMLPSDGGKLPHVVLFNAGLVVLAVLQLIVALSLANLVARWDTPPLKLTSILQGPISNFLCLSDVPLLGQVPSSVTPPWASNGDVERSEEETNKKKPDFTGWNLLAQAVDRVCFIIYVFIILCFMIAYIGGAASLKPNSDSYFA